MSDMSDLEIRLREWIDKYKPAAPESIYQCDTVQIGLYELGELVCDHLGYHKGDEE